MRSASRIQDEAMEQLRLDKEKLAQEAQHRVKNNMQIISSLMNIQERNAMNDQAKEAIEKSKRRIKSISLIHQGLLTEERPQHVSAQEYIRSLSSSVFNAYKVDKDRVNLITDIEELYLHIDTGLPLGIILNELLSNCLTHAFTDSEEGEVMIRLRERDKKLILELEDSGTHLSTEELGKRVGNFGQKMIDTFSKRLDSTLELTSEGNNKVSLIISNYEVEV